MSALNIATEDFCYSVMIGVGGVGSGSFFAIRGDQTLGREESRGGRFLDQRDYCKLHIIAHYVQRLLGPAFVTLPVGMAGDDEAGRRVCAEMTDAGMDTRYVARNPREQTLFSFCFLYPDGTGGNLTADDSASSHVDESFVQRAQQSFREYSGKGVALAAPEVPLDARAALLRMGTAHDFYRAASFTAQEMPAVLDGELLRDVDLLAINSAEAASALSLPVAAPVEEIVARAGDRLLEQNSRLCVSITGGSRGSWMITPGGTYYQPAFHASVRNSAGAGDAHLAGLIVGAVAGMPPDQAQVLANLVASLSVESQHTIHPGITRESLLTFARRQTAGIPPAVLRLLDD